MTAPLIGGFRAAPGALKVLIAVSVAAAVVLPLVLFPGLADRGTVRDDQMQEIAEALLLVAGCILTLEWGRFFKGRTLVGRRPPTGLSAWALATVIVLPPGWVLPVMIGAYGYARWRVLRVALWKWVGSCSFLVLAGLLAGWVLRAGGSGASVDLSSGLAGLLLVAAAVATFLAVESALVFTCARLSGGSDPLWPRRTLADQGAFCTEAAVLALGAVTGLVAEVAPWFVLLMLPSFGLMQQAVLHRPLRDQAVADSKTGLLQYEPWRRMASDLVSQLTSTRRPWAVLFADLDHFKIFNDHQGHLAGDAAITVVARVLRETTREQDLIARFGGEEFCVLLPGATGEQATAIAERIRRSIGALDVEQLGERLTVSIGVAGVEAGRPGMGLVEALSRADRALYMAKMQGRDAVRLAESADRSRSAQAPGGRSAR